MSGYRLSTALALLITATSPAQAADPGSIRFDLNGLPPRSTLQPENLDLPVRPTTDGIEVTVPKVVMHHMVVFE